MKDVVMIFDKKPSYKSKGLKKLEGRKPKKRRRPRKSKKKRNPSPKQKRNVILLLVGAAVGYWWVTTRRATVLTVDSFENDVPNIIGVQPGGNAYEAIV